MKLKNTTPIPNVVLDNYLPTLKGVELKLLLIIIRQTLGWQKDHDWLTVGQLVKRTGASRRRISEAIKSLLEKRLINLYDVNGKLLDCPAARKGNGMIFYSCALVNNAKKVHYPEQEFYFNKDKIARDPEQFLPTTKETNTKCSRQEMQSNESLADRAKVNDVRAQLVKAGVLPK